MVTCLCHSHISQVKARTPKAQVLAYGECTGPTSKQKNNPLTYAQKDRLYPKHTSICTTGDLPCIEATSAASRRHLRTLSLACLKPHGEVGPPPHALLAPTRAWRWQVTAQPAALPNQPVVWVSSFRQGGTLAYHGEGGGSWLLQEVHTVPTVLYLLPYVNGPESHLFLFIRAARVLCPEVQLRGPTAPIRPGNGPVLPFFLFSDFSISLD